MHRSDDESRKGVRMSQEERVSHDDMMALGGGISAIMK